MDDLERLEVVLERMPDQYVAGANDPQKGRLDLTQPRFHFLELLWRYSAVPGESTVPRGTTGKSARPDEHNGSRPLVNAAPGFSQSSRAGKCLNAAGKR